MLHLVPILSGPLGEEMERLREDLGQLLGMRTVIRQPDFDVEVAFDAVRSQYESRTLLARLRQLVPATGERILGVAGVDLFMPVLTFVFGEAELGGRAALVSSFRLHNELYGLPPDPALLFGRLFKESVHELGHTFGLVHCLRGDCVMHSSTYVEDIDLKSERYCDRCLRGLRQAQRAAR